MNKNYLNANQTYSDIKSSSEDLKAQFEDLQTLVPLSSIFENMKTMLTSWKFLIQGKTFPLQRKLFNLIRTSNHRSVHTLELSISLGLFRTGYLGASWAKNRWCQLPFTRILGETVENSWFVRAETFRLDSPSSDVDTTRVVLCS